MPGKKKNMDYQFLIGLRFSVGEDIYIVHDLTSGDGPTQVEAHISDEVEACRTFTLSDVIEWLLVDEEIELFSPNYLAAVRS